MTLNVMMLLLGLLVLPCSLLAANTYPKTEKQFAKLISDQISSSVVDTTMDTVLVCAKNGTKYTDMYNCEFGVGFFRSMKSTFFMLNFKIFL